MTHQKLGLLIGRFSPLHSGHRDLIRKASKLCGKLVVLIGSANSARNIKTPYTYDERRFAMQEFLRHEDIINVSILPLNDYKYNNTQWINDVTSVAALLAEGREIVLFGHSKEGNDYLNWFPQFNFVNITTKYEVCSTDIRNNWFEHSPHNFEQCVNDDYQYFKKEKQLFANYPFPETLNFSCSDTILECAGHILLIRRKIAPGAGTWAMPGGFKNRDETFEDCAIRELKEETNVRVPEKVLRGSIVNKRLFDAVDRGMGIPRHTLVLHIKVNTDNDGSLPRVSPASDAITAVWTPINVLLNDLNLFDDHSHVISSMCGVMPTPAHLNDKYFQ